MMNSTSSPVDIGKALLSARTVEDILALIASIPNAVWVPLGNDPGNYSRVDIAADSAKSLIEKLTNGMDAIIELLVALTGRSDFTSPREAADALLGIPGGRISNFKDKERSKLRTLAEQISLTVRDAGPSNDPTIVVEDRGIGQHPDDFSNTLVSLNQQNKIDKFYLLGAYGWGGASSYAFAKYTLYISRRHPSLLAEGQEDEVGWTIVRYNDLANERTSKVGVYEFLCLSTPTGPSVPRIAAKDLPEDHKDWSGTNCTLVEYELGRYTAEPTFRPSRSLWVLCNALLFDPVMPFLLRDERPRSITANEKSALDGIVINGSATRLAWAAERAQNKRRGRESANGDEDASEEGVTFDGSFVGRLSTGGEVTVRYWVIGESGKYKKDWEPTRTYVTPEQAITVTHNGQRHESYPRAMFEARLGLIALSKFLIVQVDCDHLAWPEKRQLLSTTRDRLKDTPVAQEVREQVSRALRSDDTLKSEEKRRKERALAHRSREQAERIRKLLDKAIQGLREGQEAKYRALLSSNTDLPLLTDQPLIEETAPTNPQQPPTGAEEQEYIGAPTFLKVLNSPIRIQAGGQAVIRFAIDAPSDYFSWQGADFIPLVTKSPDLFRIDGFSTPRDGLMRCTVSAKGASEGDRGRVLITVTRPDDLPLIEEVELIAVAAPQKRAKPAGKTTGKEQGPNIVPVYHDDWETFGFNEGVVAKLVPDTSDPNIITIYVNWDYPPLNNKLMNERKLDQEGAESYKEKFVASMGLLVWLQHQDGIDSQEGELKRAAQMHLYSTFMNE